jgi:hypothetical protein
MRRKLAEKSRRDILVHGGPVANGQDPDVGPADRVHDPVVADAQLPVPLEGAAQWRSRTARGGGETLFDRSGDAGVEVAGNKRKVVGGDGRVIEKAEHPGSAGTPSPHVLVTQGRFLGKRPFAMLGESGKPDILLELEGLAYQVPHFRGQGHLVSTSEMFHGSIQLPFKDDVDAWIGRRHVTPRGILCREQV